MSSQNGIIDAIDNELCTHADCDKPHHIVTIKRSVETCSNSNEKVSRSLNNRVKSVVADDPSIDEMRLPRLERQDNVSSSSFPGAIAVDMSNCVVSDEFNSRARNEFENSNNVGETPIMFYAINAELVYSNSVTSPSHNNDEENPQSDMITVKAKAIEVVEVHFLFRRHFLVAYFVLLVLCIGITFGVTRASDHKVEHIEDQNCTKWSGNETLDIVTPINGTDIDSENSVR